MPCRITYKSAKRAGQTICECISECSRDGLQTIGFRASFAVPNYRQIGEAEGQTICECIAQCSRDGLQAIGSRASFAVPDYRQIGKAGGTDHLRMHRTMQP
ncbi:MAG: hypothetical protein RSD08_01405 [Oscillospiraceae bacterium]